MSPKLNQHSEGKSFAVEVMIPVVSVSSKYRIQGLVGNLFTVEGSGVYHLQFSNTTLDMELYFGKHMTNDIPKDNREEQIDKTVEVEVTNLDYASSSSQVCHEKESCKSASLETVVDDDSLEASVEVKATERVVFWKLSYSLSSLLEQPFLECLSQ